MTTKDIIKIDDDIPGGTQVFKGTRLPIQNLFDYLNAGKSINEFLADFDCIPRNYCIAIARKFKRE